MCLVWPGGEAATVTISRSMDGELRLAGPEATFGSVSSTVSSDDQISLTVIDVHLLRFSLPVIHVCLFLEYAERVNPHKVDVESQRKTYDIPESLW